MASIISFWNQMVANPLLFIAVTLTLGVILVNGWTDAPNAIATCVVTRCMSPRAAILMAAVFNFLGVFVMTLLNATVAETITKMVDFGGNPDLAIIALSAALFAIVLWATLAWVFGIPTSESHALIAGLTGSAIAMHNSLDGVNGAEWIKVIYGIGISVGLGFSKRPTGPKQSPFFEAHRSWVRPPWPLCTAPRTARNLWASFCFVCICRRGRHCLLISTFLFG